MAVHVYNLLEAALLQPKMGGGVPLVRLVDCGRCRASLRCKRFMTTRLLPLRHLFSPEVHLGGERVMGATVKGQVRGGVRTLHAERLSMVELEVMGFLAALATLVDIRAARAIALVDGSAHGRRDVPTSSGFI